MKRFLNEDGGGGGDAGSGGGSAGAGSGIIATSSFARVVGPQQKLLKKVKKIRRQKIKETEDHDKAYYAGNSLTAFGGEGYSRQLDLPWRDVHDMDNAMMNAKPVSKEKITSAIDYPIEIQKQIGNHECKYGIVQGVFFIEDLVDGLLYFFVK